MTYHNNDCNDSADSHARRRRRARAFGHRRSSGARKERVLHTRVSEQLSDDIRRFAEDLRVPASNLVRNVLEEVFTMVDDVSDDVGGLFEDLLDEAEGVRDRVRHQTDSRGRGTRSDSGRRGRRHGRHRGRRHARSDAEVEEELRRDESAEGESLRATDAGESPASDEPNEPNESASDSGDAARETPTAAELFPDVLGWQPLVLNRDFACGRCKRELGAGESAFLGLAAGGLTEIALCGRCAGRR